MKGHLANVAKFAEYLAKNNNLQNVAFLCGMLHDLGKYTDEFQKYILSAKNNIVQKKIDHGAYGAKNIYNLCENKKGIERITSEVIMEVICYHHGGLPDNIDDDNFVPIIKRIDKISNKSLEQVIDRFYSENKFDFNTIFEKSVAEIEFIIKRLENRNFSFGLLIKNIYSYLVDADRLDSFCFEANLDINNYMVKDYCWDKYIDKLEKNIEEFKNKKTKTEFESTINKYRQEFSDRCKEFSSRGIGIYSLTVPTGGGKTLSSLRFALSHAKAYSKARIIYIIPFTTIIDQNAKVIRKILNCGDDLLEYHSNVINENVCDDELKNYELLCQRWDTPIIFTTMVQFLDCIYAKGNQNIRRLHSLENSIIIFDEIQALPIKCTYLFYQAIKYLNKITKSTIVLCTATQPAYNYFNNIIDIDGEIIQNISQSYNKLKRVDIIDKTNIKMTYNEVANFIIDIKHSEKSVLLIMNTVNSAQNIFDLIKQKDLQNTKTFLLTSRLCPVHRESILSYIIEELHKGSHIICISTQLIEAGVDISFSTVIRSLSGLDSIAQAAGRANRNGENTLGKTYIINVKDEKLGVLEEIKFGQTATQELFYCYNKNPDLYENNLFSPISINKYFTKFYSEDSVNKNMTYPITNDTQGDVSIYNLLENSKSRNNRYKKDVKPLSFNYRFKTAMKNFEVISSKTKTVIVPYSKGSNDNLANNLIATLLDSSNITEKYNALKKLQRYSVNIYENLYNDLKMANAFLPCEINEIDILSEMYYDNEKGVVTEKKLTPNIT